MANVTIIPARRKADKSKEEKATALRVAAYCRVSTDSDEQATSYETQIEHYTNYIQMHPGWRFAGIYADEGISGTNTKNRSEFNRLIEDCLAGNIDMVVTKSVSRFARNTLDCLKYIRKLKEKSIAVFFEKENINTLDAKGEVLLTIMASLAQQESQSLSQNVKLGVQYRFQKGEVRVNTNRFLGYDKDENGKLVINPEEAEVVKRIFREFLEGWSYQSIGDHLAADGIKTAAGSTYWRGSTVRKMLQNEKYMGDALLQKTVTTDFLNKKRAINNGLAPQYYVENDHEAIIPKDIFMNVQEEMQRRSRRRGTTGHFISGGKYALSNIVYCSHCGETYRRLTWSPKGKDRIVVWRCVSRVERKKKNISIPCYSRTVAEELLKLVVVKAINRILPDKKNFIRIMKNNIREAISQGTQKPVQALDAKIKELQGELLERVKQKQPYTDLTEQMDGLRAKKDALALTDSDNREKQRRMKVMMDFLEHQSGRIIAYDEVLVRRLIDKIVVYDDHFVVVFKSGLETQIDL